MSNTAEDKEGKFRAMTQYLRIIYSDEDVAEYLRWIIKSDTAKEYWRSDNVNIDIDNSSQKL